MNWDAAISEVILKTSQGRVPQRLEFIDFIVLNCPISINDLEQKCRQLSGIPESGHVGVVRDNAYINPVTKIIHGQDRRLTKDPWLTFDRSERFYHVDEAFATAWKNGRGL
jgi:hypothetical protein